MLLNNLLKIQDTDTFATQISDGLNYFLIFLMFAFIISSIVAVIYFSKWLTLGPKVKKRWNKILGKNKEEKNKDGVSIVKGEVVVEANYEKELLKKIEESTSPQQKLDYQVKLEVHQKEKQKAEEKIRQIEEEKLAKIQEKEDRARIKAEAKEEAKKIKEQNKKG